MPSSYLEPSTAAAPLATKSISSIIVARREPYA
jgi:hypothetical protein